MRPSWWSMLRTIRAAVAVLAVSVFGLALPPQMSDMLALDDWRTISFEIALVVLGGSAWFWSNAALAARFGIDNWQRDGAAPADFNWAAYRWLPRLIMTVSFLPGFAIAV